MEIARPELANIAKLLRLAVQYLDHPDVRAIPFAMHSNIVADRIRIAEVRVTRQLNSEA
jgi:hypothetical protein